MLREIPRYTQVFNIQQFETIELVKSFFLPFKL